MIPSRTPLWALVIALAFGCSSGEIPSDSETHFLSGCEGGCGELKCICGICTSPCETSCRGVMEGAICRASRDAPALACAADESPPAAYCDFECDSDRACSVLGEGRSCIAGVCRPAGLDSPLPDAAPPPAATFRKPDAAPAPTTDAGIEAFPVEIR